MGQTKIPVPADVMEGLEAVRLSGKTNMLDVPVVERLALEMGFPKAAIWVHEHRNLYAQGVFRGFEVTETLEPNASSQSTDTFSEPSTRLLRLFVYGTLKRGCWNHERFCKGALSIEEAMVRGRMYELPSGIPVIKVPASDIIAEGSNDIARDLLVQEHAVPSVGALEDKSRWPNIRGELLTFDDPVRPLQAIDALEGFVPGSRCLYRRVLLPVCRQDGTIVAAWCYVLGQRSVHLRASNGQE